MNDDIFAQAQSGLGLRSPFKIYSFPFEFDQCSISFQVVCLSFDPTLATRPLLSAKSLRRLVRSRCLRAIFVFGLMFVGTRARLCMCHNEKKVRDKWQAQEAVRAIFVSVVQRIVQQQEACLISPALPFFQKKTRCDLLYLGPSQSTCFVTSTVCVCLFFREVFWHNDQFQRLQGSTRLFARHSGEIEDQRVFFCAAEHAAFFSG